MKERYGKRIALAALFCLTLGLAACGKEPSSSSNVTTKEDVMVVEPVKEKEAAVEGSFEYSGTVKSESSRAKTLGSSKTVEVIKPAADAGDDDADADSVRSEWIPGVW